MDPKEDNKVPAPFPPQISLHTLASHMVPETLRLVGRIDSHQVWILIDGGSTHNFIQEHLVSALGLSTQPTQLLQVMVGNGHMNWSVTNRAGTSCFGFMGRSFGSTSTFFFSVVLTLSLVLNGFNRWV